MEPEVMQKRKLALQASKFDHVVMKITQSLRSDSETEELINWRDWLNKVAADFESLLMDTVAIVT